MDPTFGMLDRLLDDLLAGRAEKLSDDVLFWLRVGMLVRYVRERMCLVPGQPISRIATTLLLLIGGSSQRSIPW